MVEEKYIYTIDEAKADMKLILGGKGANLGEMYHVGLNVPPAIMISCQACLAYMDKPNFMESIMPTVYENMKYVEEKTGKTFGKGPNPLLVSVRSGAPVSMPGMMDTILNLGLNDETMKAMIALTNNERFVLDSYRRFIQMFGDVVMHIEHDKFEKVLSAEKKKVGPNAKDIDLKIENLKNVIAGYKALYKAEMGNDFPQDPKVQLLHAVEAVFNSWNSDRAIVYRRLNRIPNYGTAVNIQAMAFGNLNNQSLTGVAFTRDPSTGEKKRMGEYLVNAQGEDVVAGIRTPKKIEEMKDEEGFQNVYTELMETMDRLENHYHDMQDIEFTVENSRLYFLQTRNGKRAASAMIKIAKDMIGEGLISEEEAILRVDADRLTELLFRRVDEKEKFVKITKGLNASPGAVSGELVFTPKDAEIESKKGKKVILARPETKPEDIHGLIAAEGVLTERGGKTSHAAVVARGMGKPAVCGAENITINAETDEMHAILPNGQEKTYKKGDIVTIDGSNGLVIEGKAKLIEPNLTDDFLYLLQIADKIRTLKVRSNADTPLDAQNSIKFGAEGIGLCRTEHMFMAKERLPHVRKMIMSQTKDERIKHLAEIEKFQEDDFYQLFKIMNGKPVTIRLLDPPLHEFLPDYTHVYGEIQVLQYRLNELKQDVKAELAEKERLFEVLTQLHESNPMMGLRGCRLGLHWPEINEMQVRAIFNAAIKLKKEGQEVYPEIMIPLIAHINELVTAKTILVKVAKECMEKAGVEIHYKFGTMIEIPRAALTAREIATEAEFFSFGTNDLTQMTFGFSRDDAENAFLKDYITQGILKESPFVQLDREGPGRLLAMAVKEGRETRPDLKCGICGEHGGNPNSIEFCHKQKLNYVSCSPFRLVVARVAAAQAKIKEDKGKL